MIRVSWLLLLIGIGLFNDLAWCQANRIEQKDSGNLSLDLNAGQFRRKIFNVSNTAICFQSRVAYRFNNHLSLSLMLGLTRLSLDTNGEIFRDRYRLTYGAGVKLYPLKVPGIGLMSYISTSVFRFVANPGLERISSVAGSALVERRTFRYDWLEVNLDLGLEKSFDAAEVIAGLNVQVIHRQETLTEALFFNGNTTSTQGRTGIFDSGAYVRPFMGFKIHLPQRFFIVMKTILYDTDDFTFIFGLGQTGSP